MSKKESGEQMSESVLNSVQLTLNTLMQQNQRLLYFQELSYSWHRTTHQTLKDITIGVNRIIEKLDIKDSVKMVNFKDEVEMDSSIFSGILKKGENKDDDDDFAMV